MTKRTQSSTIALAVLAGMAMLVPALTRATTLSDVPTVVYGKVLGTGSAQPFQLTEGDLFWTIQRQDGVSVTLHTTLFPLSNGAFSYRLEIPHEVVAFGLSASDASIPLGANDVNHAHSDIQVNGEPATILGPGSTTLDVSQLRRTSNYRLDLGVGLVAPDSDGDGIADWWEDLYDLDKQDAGDAAGDGDGDGLSALDEYLAGFNPLVDSRNPTLATEELTAYTDGTSGLLLQTLDVDSVPDDLVYQLDKVPAVGTVYRRNAVANPASPDVALANGSTFTQQELNQGRIVYVHSGARTENLFLDVRVSDEDPGHVPSAGRVWINLYAPPAQVMAEATLDELSDLPAGPNAAWNLPSDEVQRVRNYAQSQQEGAIVWDGSGLRDDVVLSAPSSMYGPLEDLIYLSAFGEDPSHVLAGGGGDDELTGGMADDTLVGGAGDDNLQGNGGADQFIFYPGPSGNDVITDFRPTEGDVLVLAPMFASASGLLSDFVQLDASGAEPVVRVDADGDGSGFDDASIQLVGAALSSSDLRALLDGGNLLAGNLGLPPEVEVAASEPVASENGPESGAFVVTRTGDLASGLTVAVSVAGSAQNGTDYSLLAETLEFEPGDRSLTLSVHPFVDGAVEPEERVELVLLPGADYEVGAADRANVVIQDLRAVVQIEALVAEAVKTPLSPGVFLITRSAIIDQSLLVRLTIGGSAANGADYGSVLGFVNLLPFQTTALIQITPTAGADLTGGAETVDISIQPDPTYLMGDGDWARVALLDEQVSFAAWMAQHHPDASGSPADWAGEDPGGTGVPLLWRYALSLDPVSPAPFKLPMPVLRDGGLELDVPQRIGARDVVVETEASSNLQAWHGSAATVTSFLSTAAAAETEVVTHRAVPVESDSTTLYLRCRIRYTP